MKGKGVYNMSIKKKKVKNNIDEFAGMTYTPKQKALHAKRIKTSKAITVSQPKSKNFPQTLSKICEVTDEHILFEDGTEITYGHNAECCEWNYADFTQIDDIAKATLFDTSDLKFEFCDNYGFRFGNKLTMCFVPCYSEQSGYYSEEVDIYLNGELVLTATGEIID